MKIEPTRFWKAVNPGMYPGMDTSIKFEVGKTYSIPDDQQIEICRTGWHAHEDLDQVWTYYLWGSPVLEVELWGDFDAQWDKVCARHMRIVRVVPPSEVDAAEARRRGDGNRGNSNRGDHNRGDGNQGDYNRGNRNQGDYNRGNRNRGDDNRGHGNRGDYNRGHGNRGDLNRGSYNRGNSNRGNSNRGHYNRGDYNRGNDNRGHHNRGDYNRGDYSWGIGCTGPTMIPCFDGALHVLSDNVPAVVYSLAKSPDSDEYYQAVLDLGAKPRKLAQWRKRFMATGGQDDI